MNNCNRKFQNVAFGEQWEEHKFSSGFSCTLVVWCLLKIPNIQDTIDMPSRWNCGLSDGEHFLENWIITVHEVENVLGILFASVQSILQQKGPETKQHDISRAPHFQAYKAKTFSHKCEVHAVSQSFCVCMSVSVCRLYLHAAHFKF